MKIFPGNRPFTRIKSKNTANAVFLVLLVANERMHTQAVRRILF